MKNLACYTLLFCTIIIAGCKKEIQIEDKVSGNNSSNYSTDGVVTTQVSILPPVTPQTFIPNAPGGNVSYTGYDITAFKHVYIDYFQMNATYPIINIVKGTPNNNGQISAPAVYSILSGQSYTIPITILYNNVDSSTSPTIASCILNSINYHTEDYTPYSLTVDQTSGSAFSMCLVNNKPHLNFESPAKYKVLSTGYVEMADIKLTGDTSWTLNSLPINFYFPDFSSGTYPSKLLVRNNGNQIATATVVSGHGATINFSGGFKHNSGQTEILKIFGYHMEVNLPSFFVTEVGSLDSLSWTDGLGGFIPGSLNAKYFKEYTGSASLFNH